MLYGEKWEFTGRIVLSINEFVKNINSKKAILENLPSELAPYITNIALLPGK